MNSERQLALDLPHREALGRDDFLVSDSNAAAVAAVDAWPDWPHSALVLIGPAGSGKTHLVEVWRQRSGARRLGAADVTGDPLELLGDAEAVAIEDCGAGLDEAGMFHLFNAADRSGTQVLITARERPGRWGIGLSDLVSRLKRFPVVELAPPDDMLLQAVLMKLFADRQLSVDPGVIRYLTARMERSFEAARDVVARLDRAAIERKKPVSRALAAKIIAETIN